MIIDCLIAFSLLIGFLTFLSIGFLLIGGLLYKPIWKFAERYEPKFDFMYAASFFGLASAIALAFIKGQT